MKRQVQQLQNTQFDLLVIGGGITGACIAWDATLRGLRVALVEKGDFGGATSANSLKTVHGGLRYLQDGSLRLVRKMVRERQALLRIAPHLVRPLPVVMPTYRRKLVRNRFVMGTAVALNDLFSFDRNQHMDPARHLPNGDTLSRRQLLQLLPGLNDPNLDGGVRWHDAQMVNSERLTLSFIRSAAKAGAVVANYVQADGYVRDDKRVTGIHATDRLSGQPLTIHSQLVVNAAGPWVDHLLADLNLPSPQPTFPLSTAMNLVTRQIHPDVAMGLTSRYTQQQPDGTTTQRSRVLFVAPWRDFSLVGTLHAPYNGQTPAMDWPDDAVIWDFLAEVNGAYPGAALTPADVYHVHKGFLPMAPDGGAEVRLLREGLVVDHAAVDGVTGLLSAVGVKYTTGRYLAEKVVDKVGDLLHKPLPTSQTRFRALHDGDILDFAQFAATAVATSPVELPPAQLRRLLQQYGTAHTEVLALMAANRELAQPLGAGTAVTLAELTYAVQQETAVHLADVVLRRTDLGSGGQPALPLLETAVNHMAPLLGWNTQQIRQEINAVIAAYHPLPHSIEDTLHE